jgi:hypothetical protein
MQNLTKIALLLLPIWGMSRCTPSEDLLFDDPASVRLHKAMTRYDSLLVAAPQGWLMEYCPVDTTNIGAFNVHCTFAADGTVTFVSDLSSKDVLPGLLLAGNFGEAVDYTAGQRSTALYNFAGDQGLVLSFSTHGMFHIFSDPISGIPDGFMGDFEFIVRSITDTSFVLQGRRYGGYTSLRKLADHEAGLIDRIVATSNRIKASPRVTLITGGAEYRVVNEHCRMLRIFDPYGRGNLDDLLTAPYIATATGLRLLNPIDLMGYQAQSFSFDENNNLVADNRSMAMPPSKPLEELLDSTHWHFGIYFDTVVNIYADTVHLLDSIAYDTIRAANGDILFIQVDTLVYHDTVVYESLTIYPLAYDTASMSAATFSLIDRAQRDDINVAGELLTDISFGINPVYLDNRFSDLNRHGIVMKSGGYPAVYGLHFRQNDDGSIALTPTSAGIDVDYFEALGATFVHLIIDFIRTNSPYTLAPSPRNPQRTCFTSRDHPSVWFDLCEGKWER